MDRYLLFGGSCYYASGGFDDLSGSSDDLEEMKLLGEILLNTSGDFGWYHIVDLTTLSIVYRSGSEPHGFEGHGSTIVFRDKVAIPGEATFEYSQRVDPPLTRAQRIANYADDNLSKTDICYTRVSINIGPTLPQILYYKGLCLKTDEYEIARKLVKDRLFSNPLEYIKIELMFSLPELETVIGEYEEWFEKTMNL